MTNTPELPQDVIKAAEDILLSDLLKSPTFRPFTLSALGNSLRAQSKNTSTDEDDEFFQFKVRKIFQAVPPETKFNYWKAVRELMDDFYGKST